MIEVGFSTSAFFMWYIGGACSMLYGCVLHVDESGHGGGSWLFPRLGVEVLSSTV